MALTLQTVLKLSASSKTFLRGQMYYQKKKVTEFSTRLNKNGRTCIYAEVLGTENRYVEIVLDEKENITEYVCSCPAFSDHPGACKHIVAVLTNYLTQKNPKAVVMDFNKELKKLTPAVPTDPISKNLIDAYSAEFNTNTDKEEEFSYITISSTLVFNKSLPKLTFKIGSDRPYPIVNLTKFCEDVLSGAEREYGKLFKVNHNLANFDEQSRQLISIILDTYNQEHEKNSPKSELCVNAIMLDRLFDIYVNQSICLNRAGADEYYNVIDANPKLNLFITKNTNGSYTIKCDTFYLLSGYNHLYIQKNRNIYRCNEAYKNAMYSFLTNILQASEYSFNVSNADAAVFFTRVVSQVRPYVNIPNDALFIDNLLPDMLTAKLMLDEPTKGLVTGRLEFWYNDVQIKKDHSYSDIKQDIYREKRIHHIVRSYFTSYSGDHDVFTINREQSILNLIKNGLFIIGQHVDIYTTANFNRLKLAETPKTGIGVSIEGNLICLTLEIGDAKSSELIAIMESYRQKKAYHQLDNGTFIRLENKQFSKIEQLLRGLNLSNSELKCKKIKIPKYRAFFLSNFLQNDNTFSVRRSDEFDEFMQQINGVKNESINVPKSLEKVLREYQVTGYKWLKTVTGYGFSCILADDMGLGKTLQVIALLLSCKRSLPSLVVCPSSLLYNWESEIEKFGQGLKPLVISGNAVKRQALLSNIEGVDIIITSYDQLKRDIELYDNLSFEFNIIDEAQFIKNHSTLNSKSVSKIKSVSRIALTGTPIENQLSELWSIFNFLMPGYLFNYKHFKTYYEIPITRENDTHQLDSLNNIISPFILRRLKKNVLTELPEKNEIAVVTPLGERQEEIYNATILSTKEFIRQKIKENALESNQIGILSMITKLRQICCDPRLCFEDYDDNSAKLEACMEIVSSAVKGGHKVLIFSQFTSMLALIEKELKRNKVSSFLLKGSTKSKDRIEMVEKFNSDATNVFLISLKAGGTGLNLTGADIVIHYDPWWNLAAQNQATDRAYRMGQKNSVTVYKLIAKETIEEKISQLQQSKHNLAESVISNHEGVISSMSAQDIAMLFEI